jgi:hypothetical protein
MTSVGSWDEFGWGDDGPEHRGAWRTATSGALVVATGCYFATVWILSGLVPFGRLAHRGGAPKRTVCEAGGEPPIQ